MAQDDQIGQTRSDIAPPVLLQYTVEQYMESPALVKQTNEWLHSIYQHLSEKDKQLQSAEHELKHLKEECLRLRKIEKALEETKQDLVEKDRQLQLTKQALGHFQEGSLKASIIQHGLGLVAAVSFGVGINFVTSTPSNIAGWFLIFIAIAIQSISFYITYSEARKNI